MPHNRGLPAGARPSRRPPGPTPRPARHRHTRAPRSAAQRIDRLNSLRVLLQSIGRDHHLAGHREIGDRDPVEAEPQCPCPADARPGACDHRALLCEQHLPPLSFETGSPPTTSTIATGHLGTLRPCGQFIDRSGHVPHRQDGRTSSAVPPHGLSSRHVRPAPDGRPAHRSRHSARRQSRGAGPCWTYSMSLGDEVVTGWHSHDLYQLAYALEGVADVISPSAPTARGRSKPCASRRI